MGDRARADADYVKFYFQRTIYLSTASGRSCLSLMAADGNITTMITRFAVKWMNGVSRQKDRQTKIKRDRLNCGWSSDEVYFCPCIPSLCVCVYVCTLL